MQRNILLILVLCPLLVMGCKAKKPPPPPQNTIHLNFAYPPLSFDPRKSTEPITSVMNTMLYEGLLHLEPDGTLTLALAKDVQVSKDNLSYLFFLRPSFWSDGTPLTAYDFEYTWKKVLDPHYPSKAAHLLFVLKNGLKAKKGECSLDAVGVKALDENTLLVKLNYPIPYFLKLLAYPTYFPVPHQGEEILYQKKGSTLVTNGPFTLLSWKNTGEIIVEKNPYYWQEERVKIEQIHISTIADEHTALTLFEKGKLDWIGGIISPLPLDAIPFLKQANLICKRPIAGTTFCTFNTTHAPFHNINIRKAFAHAINRRALVENVTQMCDDIAVGLIPPILKERTPPTKRYIYQEALAKKYLEKGLQELGITRQTFPPLSYSYFSSELQRKLALALQNQWYETLGIQITLECNEPKVHFAKLHKRHYDFAQMSWIAQYFDPMTYLERLKTQDKPRNYPNWESPPFTHLIKQAHHAHPKAYLPLLEKAEAIVMAEVPMTPFYHYHLIYLQNPQLKNVGISPLGTIEFRHAFFENVD